MWPQERTHDHYGQKRAERGIANHSKAWIVDDHMFYIGSQNIYPAAPASNQEYGWIIEGESETAQLLEEYWNPLWHFTSKQTYDLSVVNNLESLSESELLSVFGMEEPDTEGSALNLSENAISEKDKRLIAKGEAKGRAETLAEAEAKIKLAKEKMVMQMKGDGIASEAISKYTGLSEGEITDL